MFKLLGGVVIAAAFLLGIVVGIAVFINGVTDIVSAVQATPVIATTLAWGIVQVGFLAECLGGLTAYIGMLIGVWVWNLGRATKTKLRSVKPSAREVERDWEHITRGF